MWGRRASWTRCIAACRTWDWRPNTRSLSVSGSVSGPCDFQVPPGPLQCARHPSNLRSARYPAPIPAPLIGPPAIHVPPIGFAGLQLRSARQPSEPRGANPAPTPSLPNSNQRATYRPCRPPAPIRVPPSCSNPRTNPCATHPVLPPAPVQHPQLQSSSGATRGPPAPIRVRGPPLRSACHPSSPARSLFPGENPKPYCLGEENIYDDM